MLTYPSSTWGIKPSGTDITTRILGMIHNAKRYILVCGYNFTFSKSATSRPFFDALIAKKKSGVEVLLIFPPILHGKYNPQPKIIHYCLKNKLPVILSYENHSKWLLTDKELYYGSSNFTNASWKKRIEVISIHDHTQLSKTWAKDTVNDFVRFINSEVSDLRAKRRTMKSYRGLLTSTRNAWSQIKPLIQKFNPSIIRVVETLENYERIQMLLSEQLVEWYYNYSQTTFELIFKLSSNISTAVDELSEFAYGNIYNESVSSDAHIDDPKIIESYNSLYYKVLQTIDENIADLEQSSDAGIFSEATKLEDNIISELTSSNLELIDGFITVLNQDYGQNS